MDIIQNYGNAHNGIRVKVASKSDFIEINQFIIFSYELILQIGALCQFLLQKLAEIDLFKLIFILQVFI